ncbi:RcnB family protein [Xanthomonas hyacinthi]|uniref:RcnB family protein n=1 Tax=Xanthomonas hyacinthi TaxID=56455 RepID=UPI003CCE1313
MQATESPGNSIACSSAGDRVPDHRKRGLKAPPRGHEWRRVDNQYVPIADATGVISGVIANSRRRRACGYHQAPLRRGLLVGGRRSAACGARRQRVRLADTAGVATPAPCPPAWRESACPSHRARPPPSPAPSCSAGWACLPPRWR